MNFGIIDTRSCENVVVPPTADPRCSDPAFAIANPTICTATPRLIIKPDSGLVCLFGGIQLKAFLVTNDAESDVTDQTTFSTSNPDVVVVGAISGNATGISSGTALITGTYKSLTTQADITVLAETDCCKSQKVAMLVVLDVSKSMSQQFNGTYPTKLDYAKAAIKRYISEINEQKDVIGLMTFDSVSANVLSAPTSDKLTVRDMVDGIVQGVNSTSFYSALQTAISTINAVTADRKVLVIVSDGQDENPNYTTNNPISICDDFKNSGNTITCLGVRASGTGFTLLDLFSSGGLFVNGYDTTAQQALDILSGLKGYFCAGNCTPQGDVFQSNPALNYTSLTNWDILTGTINLVGNGLFDVLPGNGLYLAMDASECEIRSKTTFDFEAGKTYRIRLYLGGNQKMDNGPATVKIEIGSLFSHTVSISNFAQGFANNSFNFTPNVNESATLTITTDIGSPSIAEWGPLVDAITLDNVTDRISMLSDSFDTENSQYVPPACGIGTVYTSTGYQSASSYDGCYGSGCLETPPGAQLPDINPLPDIESGYTPPTLYSSTKTACVSCPNGSVNQSAVNLIPVMTSNTSPSGTAFASSSIYAGIEFYAFDGLVTAWDSDFSGVPQWVGYIFPSAVVVRSYAVTIGYLESSDDGFTNHFIGPPTAWTLDGSNDGSNWTTIDSRSNISWFDNERKLFSATNSIAYRYYRLKCTAVSGRINSVQIRALEMFGDASTQACATASATSYISQADADAKALADATNQAQALLNCVTVYNSTESYTAVCPATQYGLQVTKSASAQSFASQADADAQALALAQALAEAALDCTLSNNTNTVTILDNGPASPYPSVKYVSGLTGTISKVTVSLKKLSHTWPDDLIVVLMHPDGTKVVLMGNCGGSNTVNNLDIVFDDDAASSLPDNDPLTSGTFKPTMFTPIANMALPMPGSLVTNGFDTTLASLIGKDKQGSWSLWVLDDSAGNTGQILDGWDLTIT